MEEPGVKAKTRECIDGPSTAGTLLSADNKRPPTDRLVTSAQTQTLKDQEITSHLFWIRLYFSELQHRTTYGGM